jgi:hypothetical protein
MHKNSLATLGACLYLSLALSAEATSIVFSWSGYLEPRSDENPWQLDGDGVFNTLTDGTPFTVTVSASAFAQQLEGSMGNLAFYPGESASLTFGGQTFTTVPLGLTFWDSRDTGVGDPYDSINVTFDAVFFGESLRFSSSLALDQTTFSFDDPSNPYLLPFFESTVSDRALGGFTVNNVLATVPAGTPISVSVVPLPPAAALLITSLLSLLALRKRPYR